MESKTEVLTEQERLAKDAMLDHVIDTAVDHAAMMQEREMALALWKLMNKRPGRRRPHRSFACQELPEVAAKLKAKKLRKQSLAKKARKANYRNRH